MTPATIHRIWIGNVARFHHNTDHRLRNGGDCTQSHQCRVAQLLALIFADATAEELCQAVLHDVATYGVKKSECKFSPAQVSVTIFSACAMIDVTADASASIEAV